jgi:hypothetical protein
MDKSNPAQNLQKTQIFDWAGEAFNSFGVYLFLIKNAPSFQPFTFEIIYI